MPGGEAISGRPLQEYFANREAALLAEAEASGIFSSSTGTGRAREHFVSRFLVEHLPSRLVPGRGELIDSSDRRSGEVDCVLIDHESQAYRLGGESLVPIEAATAVLEVKSSLAGEELEGAIRKVARVKSLVRTAHTGMYRLSGESQSRVPVPPVTTQAYIVAYGAPAWESINARLAANPQWFENDWWRLGPELIVVLGRGLVYKNDRHYWLSTPPGAPGNAAISDSAIVRLDRPGTQLLVEHVQETVSRYGALTYELAAYQT